MNKIDYLINLLSEECNEVGQMCSKILRFGLEEVRPEQEFTNKERLIQEVNDLLAVLELLQAEGVDLTGLANSVALAKKKTKVEKFMELSRAQGKLDEV